MLEMCDVQLVWTDRLVDLAEFDGFLDLICGDVDVCRCEVLDFLCGLSVGVTGFVCCGVDELFVEGVCEVFVFVVCLASEGDAVVFVLWWSLVG